MSHPEALYVSWQHGQIPVRHDDERLGPYSPAGAVIRNAVGGRRTSVAWSWS